MRALKCFRFRNYYSLTTIYITQVFITLNYNKESSKKIRQNRESVLPRHKHTAAQMITDDEFIEILILNMLGLDDEIFKDLCMLLSAEFLGSYVIMIYTHTYTHTYVEEKQSTPYLLGFFYSQNFFSFN